MFPDCEGRECLSCTLCTVKHETIKLKDDIRVMERKRGIIAEELMAKKTSRRAIEEELATVQGRIVRMIESSP